MIRARCWCRSACCPLSSSSVARRPRILHLSLCFPSVCQFCRLPSLHSLLALPQAALFHFASLCLHLSPLSSRSPGLAVYLYATAPLFLHLTLCCFVAVVLRILPHAQTGPERLRVLLQDQRAEKEVAGAVWHGHVSVRHRRGA